MDSSFGLSISSLFLMEKEKQNMSTLKQEHALKLHSAQAVNNQVVKDA